MALTRLLKTEIGEQGGGFTGTAVDPTAKLMLINSVTINPGVNSVRLTDEERGTLYPAYTGYVESVIPTFTLGGYLAPEEAPYYLDSLFGKATPTGGGGGTVAYTYAYAATGTATSSPRVMTLVRGQAGSKIYGLKGAIINKLTIKIASGKPWEFTAEGIGYNVLTDAFGSALADRTVTLATASSTTVYMDAAGGTIGSTALSTTAFEAEITLENKRVGDQYIGSLLLGGQHENQWEGSLKLTMELNSTSDELLEDLLSATPTTMARLFRFRYDNGLSAQNNRRIDLDLSVFNESAPEIFQDKDGLVTFDWEGAGIYDTGVFAQWCKASVINNTSAMA